MDEHHDDLAVLACFHAEAGVAGALRLSHGHHEVVELGVAVARVAGAAVGVIEAVDPVDAHAHNHIGGIAALDEREDSCDGDRRHEALSELVAGEGLIADGRLIGIAPADADGTEGVAAVDRNRN